jgi:3-hydroxyacyl-[acyl-carrier-protein] dehydratase
MHHLAERVIPASHPSLPGHFPGQPIVPGVLILDVVVQALREWRPHSRVAALPNVKFLSPLLPGEPFSIELSQEDASRPLRFDCRAGERRLAQGQITLTEHSQ